MRMEIAQRLTQLRKAQGYSQEELAERLGISRQAVSKWERGESSPDTDNLIALARLYGCTLDALVYGDTEADDARPTDAAHPEEPSAAPPAADVDLPEGSFYDQPRPRFRKDFPYPLLVTVLYLVLGFCFGLWHPGWLIFLTIPLYYLPDSERGYLRLLCNPIMVTIIYLLLGFYCNWWHPGWIIFLIVPLLNWFVRKR